jgi:protoheme IX farnesyltransferase
MYVYAAATVAVSVVPVAVGDLGAVYLAAALAVGAWIMVACHRYWRDLELARARRVFLASLGYLAVLFAAIPLDVALG